MHAMEDRVRAALTARTDQIQLTDLRPVPFPVPAPARAGRSRWMQGTGALLGAAAATAGILLTTHLLPGSPPQALSPSDTAAATLSVSAAAPLSVTLTSVTKTLPGTNVLVTEPVVTVTGGAPEVAATMSGTIAIHLEDLVTSFRNRALDPASRSGSTPGEETFDQITATQPTRWRRYLSIRFDESAQTGGAHPNNGSTVLTFDTTTGHRITANDLFTRVDQVSALARAALVASRTDGSVTADDLAPLSLAPSEEGGTTPLTWYPTPSGLHCRVDQGSRLPYAAGTVEATVPWTRLTALLIPEAAS